MESGTALLTAWSFGLVGAAYLALAFRLLVLGYVKAPVDWPRVSLVCAVLFCSLWGWLTLGFLTTGSPILALSGELADLLRYAAWYTFLLLIFTTSRDGPILSGNALMPSGMGWMVPVAVLLVAF